ncbi:murein hydrolase activator EnvC [Dysgonomonas sp. 25]|uniref:murein hydrolase activator EnvC family protein n=1 Tax=Dysgonomonas sp. 25 TaxID=2302933 RepID=UPI0013D674DE|nr:peptidoglycan DD-metalloendopeptidase family protein [Dysgonomonas sp. 25]NDV68645.1 hypothetical protein [Dysgonomonas sp. 25]
MKKLILLFVLSLIVISSFAQNDKKIKELEQQRKQMLLEISNTDKMLRDMKKNTNTILSRIKLINAQIDSRKKVVGLLGEEVTAIDVQQKGIEQEIGQLEVELKEKRESYAKAVDAVMRNRKSENKLLFVLSGRSLTETYRRLRYLRDYSEYRSNQAAEILEKQAVLKAKKDTLIQTKAEKTALLKQREIEQENLKKEEATQQSSVKEAQKKQKDLQKILNQKKQQAKKLNGQIEKLIAEDIARQEKKAKEEASKGTGKTTTSGGKTMTNEDVKLSGSFAANKGKLPMPVTGQYTITTRFGKQKNQQWKAVETTSNGIDIQAKAGADARAVFDGEVTLVAAFPGYNNYVIVRHGDYYTFYANIHTLKVKKGDKVKTNQSLGQLFTDPDTGASELHFQLWKGTTKQNPEPWLRR